MKEHLKTMKLTYQGIDYNVKVYDDFSTSCTLELGNHTTHKEGTFTEVREAINNKIREYNERNKQ